MTQPMDAATFKNLIFNFETSDEFKFVGPQPIILNFHASWCGPCHMFAPTLEEISNDYVDQLKIFKIDIDQNPEIPALFGIRSVPTTVFLQPNEEPALAVGAMAKESMQNAILDLFQIEKSTD